MQILSTYIPFSWVYTYFVDTKVRQFSLKRVCKKLCLGIMRAICLPFEKNKERKQANMLLINGRLDIMNTVFVIVHLTLAADMPK